MHVLIIGAGTGGLCLAQGLRRRGISVAVYERNDATADALAGYGIHLDQNGWMALASYLPRERFERLDRVASHARTELHFRSETLKLLATRDEAWLSGSPENEVERRGVGRIALRKFLIEGIEDSIHWGCEFERYEHDGDQVVAHFRDGSRAIGDILVGADASHSRVRQQRLPELDRIDLGILNVAGRFSLDEEGDVEPPRVPHRRQWLALAPISPSRSSGSPAMADWMKLISASSPPATR